MLKSSIETVKWILWSLTINSRPPSLERLKHQEPLDSTKIISMVVTIVCPFVSNRSNIKSPLNRWAWLVLHIHIFILTVEITTPIVCSRFTSPWFLFGLKVLVISHLKDKLRWLSLCVITTIKVVWYIATSFFFYL